MTDAFQKMDGARVTFAPWADCDSPSVVASVGISSQAVVLRHLALADLLRLAAGHIEDLHGDDVLALELEARAEAADE